MQLLLLSCIEHAMRSKPMFQSIWAVRGLSGHCYTIQDYRRSRTEIGCNARKGLYLLMSWIYKIVVRSCYKKLLGAFYSPTRILPLRETRKQTPIKRHIMWGRERDYKKRCGRAEITFSYIKSKYIYIYIYISWEDYLFIVLPLLRNVLVAIGVKSFNVMYSSLVKNRFWRVCKIVKSYF